MENSKIEWTDLTFNLWRGCTKVSPACAHCYAETLAKRNPAVLGQWGKGAPRVFGKPAYNRRPLVWNERAARGQFRQCLVCGLREFRKRSEDRVGLACCSNPNCLSLPETESMPVRPRVFALSMGDWLDDEVPIEWLADLLLLIFRTPNLDWLLLTKRPQNFDSRVGAFIRKYLILGVTGNYVGEGLAFSNWLAEWERGNPPANVWIGATVEDRTRADERIPLLLSIPAKVRFLSCEPLLGPLEFSDVTRRSDALKVLGRPALSGIHWVICGGESGPSASPMHPDWARSIRNQCAAVGVPFLFKQWGARPPMATTDGRQILPFGDYILPAANGTGGFGFLRMNKKAAGRLLDGRTHDEFPAPVTA